MVQTFIEKLSNTWIKYDEHIFNLQSRKDEEENKVITLIDNPRVWNSSGHHPRKLRALYNYELEDNFYKHMKIDVLMFEGTNDPKVPLN